MSVPDRASPRSDAMPTTRGTNFYLADPNLEFVWSARKLMVAALHVKRWLRPPPAPVSVLTARERERLDAIADWGQSRPRRSRP